MSKVKAKRGRLVYTLRLSEAEATALYHAINVNQARSFGGDQAGDITQEIEHKLDTALAENEAER